MLWPYQGYILGFFCNRCNPGENGSVSKQKVKVGHRLAVLTVIL